ncbi:copper-sensing transcriptional repressor CsoR [soil metagenome]
MPRTHYDEDKDKLQLRLRKMEGQVRGLQQMIADDRYCLDVVQQVNALTSAAREVSLLVMESHLRATISEAVQSHDGESAIREMVDVLRKALRTEGL